MTIPSPTAYRIEKGLPYSPAVADNPMWGNKIVNDILKNPHLYWGFGAGPPPGEKLQGTPN